MTDRREEGFAVAPQRLGGGSRGGGGRRRRRLAIAAVVAGGALVVGIAVMGPRLSDRPNLDLSYFGTPTPSPALSPSVRVPGVPSAAPGVTPLPFLTGLRGPLPGVRLGVAADGFRVLDLGAGTVSRSVVADPATDAVVAAPDGTGWTCVCMVDPGTGTNGFTRVVDLVRIGPDGSELDRRAILTIDGGAEPASSRDVKTDIQVDADGRSALLAVAQQRQTGWDIGMVRVDLTDGRTSKLIRLGTVGSGPVPGGSRGATSSPPTSADADIDISGPSIRRSPDGTEAFVWTTWAVPGAHVLSDARVTGWRVRLDGDGTPVAAASAPGLSQLEPSCTGGGFVRADRFLAVCTVFPTDLSPAAAWQLTELDGDGAFVDQIELPETAHFYVDPLLDTANGIAWIWNPTDFVLLRVDANGLRLTSQTFDAGALDAPGSRDFGGRTPAWGATSSSVLVNRPQQIVGSPDGSRLYLLAYGPITDLGAGRPPSLGTLVVNPRTLALLDHWPADAAALAVTPIANGSIVAIAGLPGADAAGNSVGWQGSLTFHRSDDGSVLVQFGQLGTNYLPLLVAP